MLVNVRAMTGLDLTEADLKSGSDCSIPHRQPATLPLSHSCPLSGSRYLTARGQGASCRLVNRRTLMLEPSEVSSRIVSFFFIFCGAKGEKRKRKRENGPSFGLSAVQPAKLGAINTESFFLLFLTPSAPLTVSRKQSKANCSTRCLFPARTSAVPLVSSRFSRRASSLAW